MSPLASSSLIIHRYKHPYAAEIEALHYPSDVYSASPPIPYSDPNESGAIFVDTEEAVQEMLEELKNAKEIAIDLEHNDRNSFVGLVCLMQISTREKDWIVDTLKPWRENLQILNEVFADPKIVKVFHGANMDMIWLQRDLGLYVVGLFDTYHASCALQFPGKSLKYLLERFAGFHAQKQFQMADWRVRPLPPHLIDYARSDTHYLLYIYDELRNMLLEASTPQENLISTVLEASKVETLQIYERPVYDPENGLGPLGWFSMLMQRSSRFDNEQFGVFRALHEWRDKKARDLDEGHSSIMSNQILWNIAESMPNAVPNLHASIRPMPYSIRENAREIVAVVEQGKKEGADGPSVRDMMAKNEDKFTYKSHWKKKAQRDAEGGSHGVGATLRLLSQNGELPPEAATIQTDDVADAALATRSSSSHFWGAVPTVTGLNMSAMLSIAQSAMETVLPLPLASKIVNDGNVEGAKSPPFQPAQPSSVTSGTSQVELVSTNDIHRTSRKRKADDFITQPEQPATVSANGAASNGPVSSPLSQPFQMVDIEEEQRREEKRQRKAEKKAAKEAAAATAEGDQPPIPFDYASAESMLHAKPEQKDDSKKGKRNKPVNPFAKSLDTSTGARRSKMGKELAGKSFTFRS